MFALMILSVCCAWTVEPSIRTPRKSEVNTRPTRFAIQPPLVLSIELDLTAAFWICRTSARSLHRTFDTRYPLLAVKSDFLRASGWTRFSTYEIDCLFSFNQ